MAEEEEEEGDIAVAIGAGSITAMTVVTTTTAEETGATEAADRRQSGPRKRASSISVGTWTRRSP